MGYIIYKDDRAAICFPAEEVDKEKINMLMKNGDEIRIAMPWRIIESLGLNSFKFEGKNLISVDFNGDLTASGRLRAIRKILSGEIYDAKFPGKIFIEEVKENGVLERPGFGEAAIDVAKMKGYSPISVYAFLLNQEGEFADKNYALKFAEENDFEAFSMEELISKRLKEEKAVKRVVETRLPTKFYGEFKAIGYETPIGEVVALVRGESLEECVVRIHSECLTGDVFHSLRCDCGEQLERALKKIDSENKGVLIYMKGHEGRGIGLINKLMAYKLQDEGKDTVEANLELGFPPDMRSYGIAAQILMDLGVKKVRLMTNNPEKIEELKNYGFDVVREPIEIEPSEENLKYLKAKREKLGHFLCIND